MARQKASSFYCTLHTDFPDDSTDAVARYVSFAKITCFIIVAVIAVKPHLARTARFAVRFVAAFVRQRANDGVCGLCDKNVA